MVAISKLFKMILNTSFSSEQLRKEIIECRIDLKETFNFMDYKKDGFLTKDSLKTFLNKFSFYALTEDLDNLMDRFDRNNSNKIAYEEFEYELLPKLN